MMLLFHRQHTGKAETGNLLSSKYSFHHRSDLVLSEALVDLT